MLQRNYLNMTSETVLKEIEEIDVKKLPIGDTFYEAYCKTGKYSLIEQVLFWMPCKKYYYNYAEKRLRFIEMGSRSQPEEVIEKGDGILFECFDVDGDDSVFRIKSKSFSERRVCYEDIHKVVTYDPNSKNYECFFVAMEDSKIREFFNSIREHLPEVMKHLLIKVPDETKPNKSHKTSKKKELPEVDCPDNVKQSKNSKKKSKNSSKKKKQNKHEDETDDDAEFDEIIEEMFQESCKFIAHYLMNNSDDLSGMHFDVTPDGCKVEMITSKLFVMGDIDDDESEIPPVIIENDDDDDDEGDNEDDA